MMDEQRYTGEQMMEIERRGRVGAIKGLFDYRSRPSWVNSVEIQQVVVVRSCWGVGMGRDEGIPAEIETFREITEVFDMKGNLIVREDPCEGRG